jgi:hypothetical protein
MINLHAWLLALPLAFVAGAPVSSANAQDKTPEAVPRPPAAEAQSPSAANDLACDGGPVIYWAGSGPKVQVRRLGKISQENPLRLNSEVVPALVIEVNINGKIATAHGQSFEAMRRAGPPQQLEEESGQPIEWDAKLAGLPKTILILSDQGSEVVARLQFTECGKAPKPARRRDLPAKAQLPNPPSPRSASESPHRIPQGAIQ